MDVRQGGSSTKDPEKMSRVVECVYVGQPDACACGCKCKYIYSAAAFDAAETDARHAYVGSQWDEQTVASVVALIDAHPGESVPGDGNVSLKHEGKLCVINYLAKTTSR
jgi:hypothetical protein